MPERLEESPWAKVAAIVGGAGASAAIASQVQRVAPQVGAEIAGAGTGLIMYLYGDRLHSLVKWAGIGVIAGALMPRVSGWLGGILPKAGLPAAGAQAPSSAYDAALAYMGGR